MKANVLGVEYEIKFANEDTDPYLANVDGYCDETIKSIVVDDMSKTTEYAKKDLKSYQDKCVRHELFHAFLYESGLAENSSWALNEEMVDWFARQFPKIKKEFEKLNII